VESSSHVSNCSVNVTTPNLLADFNSAVSWPSLVKNHSQFYTSAVILLCTKPRIPYLEISVKSLPVALQRSACIQKRRAIKNVVEFSSAKLRVYSSLGSVIPKRKRPRRSQLEELLIRCSSVRKHDEWNLQLVGIGVAAVNSGHSDVVAPETVVLGSLVLVVEHAHPLFPVVLPFPLIDVTICCNRRRK
jgi:hypothetical protein